MGTKVDTTIKPGSRKGRLNYSPDFKKHVALASCEPGVSVSKLALEHKLNANMVFKWRREYRAGLFDGLGSVSLLPVEVVAPREPRRTALAAPAPKPARHLIEIIIADAVVRVDGAVDPALLRTVIQSLRA